MIALTGVERDAARGPVAAAFDEIERLERVLSEWRADSEISAINRAAGRRAVPVGSDTMAVVRAGLDVSRWSGGAFDLSWAALRGLYDFRRGRGRVPRAAALRARLRRVDYRQIEVDESASTVFLKRPGMAIGTGSIAKGYALDRAGAILRAAGIHNYMLFAGGQVQLRGRRPDRPWRVGVQHPRSGGEGEGPLSHFAVLEAEGGSISTSGDYEHYFVDADRRRWHHIIDPQTGRPAGRSVSATLVAEDGLYADALSTACFVMGPEPCIEMLGRIPQRASAVIVGPEFRLYMTRDMPARLHPTIPLVEGRLPMTMPGRRTAAPGGKAPSDSGGEASGRGE